jgi:SAM-dependent methyltransferase
MQNIELVIRSIENDPLESTGHVYHPIPFDEFSHLKSSSRPAAAYRKWNLIDQVLPFQDYANVWVLDIGANAGFFAYQFAKYGAHVDALEPLERYYEIGVQISEHYDLSIEWFKEPISIPFLQSKNYDVTLMLSVFQWMSQGSSHLDEAKSILRAVSERSDYLIFELGCNWGKSAIKVREPALKWIVDLIRRFTAYSNIAYLGTTNAWGGQLPLVRVVRKRHIFACSNGELNLTSWQHLRTKFANWL